MCNPVDYCDYHAHTFSQPKASHDSSKPLTIVYVLSKDNEEVVFVYDLYSYR